MRARRAFLRGGTRPRARQDTITKTAYTLAAFALVGVQVHRTD